MDEVEKSPQEQHLDGLRQIYMEGVKDSRLALCRLQDEVWSDLEKWNRQLRSNLSGIQPESRIVVDSAVAEYAAWTSTEPLSLDVLRAELGEPTAYEEGMLWQRPGYFVASSASAETIVANGDPESPDAACSLMAIVTTLGQLRRILSVVREQEAAKAGEK